MWFNCFDYVSKSIANSLKIAMCMHGSNSICLCFCCCCFRFVFLLIKRMSFARFRLLLCSFVCSFFFFFIFLLRVFLTADENLLWKNAELNLVICPREWIVCHLIWIVINMYVIVGAATFAQSTIFSFVFRFFHLHAFPYMFCYIVLCTLKHPIKWLNLFV